MAEEAAPTTDYIAYPEAMKTLADRLGATPGELAMWLLTGPDSGGIAAYLNANELDPPPRFHIENYLGKDYVSLLMSCWFRQDDIEKFDPADRYITGAALIKRWGNQLGPDLCPEAFILAKIAESRLEDMHPTFGVTQGTFRDDPFYPTLLEALFAIKDIELVEAEDAVNVTPIPFNSAAELATVLPISHSPDAPLPRFGDACAVFRDMPGLNFSEVSIAFVGDSANSGLAGNNMLEISARGVKRRMSLGDFDLIDRRGGELSKKAALLIGLAHGKRIMRNNPKVSMIVSRLRSTLRNRLGIKADPFEQYDDDIGWLPKFSIVDCRGRSDQRAKENAELRTESLDQLQEGGRQFSSNEEEYPFDEEEDGTADWMKTRGS